MIFRLLKNALPRQKNEVDVFTFSPVGKTLSGTYHRHPENYSSLQAEYFEKSFPTESGGGGLCYCGAKLNKQGLTDPFQ